MIVLVYREWQTSMHIWQQLNQWFPHLWFGISTLWIIYMIILSVWIVLQKREAAATLSWVFALAFLPVIGFLIYHFLGPQRIKRQRLKRVRSRARLDKNNSKHDVLSIHSPLMQLTQASTGFAPSQVQSVQLFADGISKFDALIDAIQQAKHHVHLEYYIFEPDQTGTRVRNALIEKAQSGVQVRLLIDAIGSARVTERFLAPLRQAGADVAFFHRTLFRWRGLWAPKLNLRSHRKIVIIDGRLGFTGGINITDDENGAVSRDYFHDLHLCMQGDAVRWLQLAFIEDWAYAGKNVPKGDAYWPESIDGAIHTQVIPAGPDSPWEPIHRSKLFAISQAKTRVWLTTPYFVPGEAARMALTSAALRGLDVRLLVPKRSDSRLVTAAAASYFDELLAAGIRIYEYPRMLHTKALLIDQETVILGSSNFDNRSFRLNFELCVLFENLQVASSLETIMSKDFDDADLVTSPRPLGFAARLAEAGARLLSPLL
jgi:cardiolipin synthase A/B